MNDTNKSPRVNIGDKMMDTLERLRRTIIDATDEIVGKDMSYKQLLELLSKKINNAKISFKYP